MKTPLVTTLRRDLIPTRPYGTFFDDFFGDLWARPDYLPTRFAEMPAMMRARMDVIDKGSAYLVTIEMPGVRKEDINVSIDGMRVSVSAETTAETPVKEGEKLIYTERSATSYARSFDLPTEVLETGADAIYDNGVLTLTLPKKVASPVRKLEIH